jgi:hypothetical protein
MATFDFDDIKKSFERFSDDFKVTEAAEQEYRQVFRDASNADNFRSIMEEVQAAYGSGTPPDVNTSPSARRLWDAKAKQDASTFDFLKKMAKSLGMPEPVEPPGWDSSKPFKVNLNSLEPDPPPGSPEAKFNGSFAEGTKNMLEIVKTLRGGSFDEKSGTPDQQEAAKKANGWLKTIGTLAAAGVTIDFLVHAVEKCEQDNSTCTVTSPDGSNHTIPCDIETNDDLYSLRLDCTCLQKQTDGPCGTAGSSCKILSDSKVCPAPKDFEDWSAVKATCANKYSYVFRECDFMCGVWNFLKSLNNVGNPFNWFEFLKKIGGWVLVVVVGLMAVYLVAALIRR